MSHELRIPGLADKVTLITGGTSGIGLATGLAFGRQGAQTILTYRWGSADEDQVRAQFREVSAPEPWILQADAGKHEDTVALITTIKQRFSRVDHLVSNAASSILVNGLSDYTERKLFQSLRACAWPTFDYLTQLNEILGSYPRHTVVMSSDGPDRFTEAYDFVAASKALTETLCRYVQFRLRDEPVNINVVRSRAVLTESFDSTFGPDFQGFLRALSDDVFMTPEEVAEAALALCSGWFDGVRGQVITVDHGNTFADGITLAYEHRKEKGL